MCTCRNWASRTGNRNTKGHDENKPGGQMQFQRRPIQVTNGDVNNSPFRDKRHRSNDTMAESH